MFVDPAKIGRVQACRIAGFGLATIGEEHRYDNRRYLLEKLTKAGRGEAYKHFASGLSEEEQQLEAVDQSFRVRPGILSRLISPKRTVELGVEAALDAVARTGYTGGDFDAIIGASNTGPGYPSLADFIKLGLGVRSEAATNDLTEACSSGLAAVFDAWRSIRSGVFKRVLVVAAENAFTLPKDPDNYIASDLFGSRAVGVVLEAAATEQFLFLEQDSDPFEEKIGWIQKDEEHGFRQAGSQVHKFVCKMIPRRLARACERINLDQAEVKHVIFHQASGTNIDLLDEKLRLTWPRFTGSIPQNVRTVGNVSAAGALGLLAEESLAERIKPGEVVVSYAFGSGMSWAGMGYTA